MKSVVSVSHSEIPEIGLKGALDNISHLEDIFKGKHVAIKPNETWASAQDLTACTQSDTLKAVIGYVKQFKPKKITVTGGSGGAKTEQIFSLLGFNHVIEKEGVEFFDHNKPPFEKVALEYGPTQEIVVNPHIFSFDTIVSLAQLKVHAKAEVTLTMKNIAMSFPCADYYGYPRYTYKHSHQIFFSDLHGFIASMCHRFPIHLGIIAGHPAMVGTGPIGGKTFESGLYLASRDYVSVDSIGAQILGKPNVSHIMLAQEYGDGISDPEDIEIRGMGLEQAIDSFAGDQI
ncbi:Iron-sulfur cluster-binding protein [Chitinispirillum alkaliphilum]|nr:Iron-sulfur cluster-binding protein [Chitinispirillum alkaliphilum]